MFSIMIVDDEPYIRRGLTDHIPWTRAGVTDVRAAASGIQALGMLAERPADVLITDIRMNGMDGLELIAQARTLCPDMRVIVLTGYDEFEYARACLRMHVNDFLLKPVEEEELLLIVKRLFQYMKGTAPAGPLEVPADATVQKAKDFIRSNLDGDLSVARIAGGLFITPAYLTRLFKRATGEGVSGFVTHMRMERSCALLKGTNLPVGRIAEMVGYKDQNYFSLAFKKHTGRSPGAYRKEGGMGDA